MKIEYGYGERDILYDAQVNMDRSLEKNIQLSLRFEIHGQFF